MTRDDLPAAELDAFDLWRKIRRRRFVGDRDPDIAEDLGLSIAGLELLFATARELGWESPPTRPAATVHVAGPPGDDHYDQRCARCYRVLRLRRYQHVATEFFRLGARVFETPGGRLQAVGVRDHLEIHCEVRP